MIEPNWYFLHIPKTAGTSFHRLMITRFGNALCLARNYDQLYDDLDGCRRCDAFHGHFGVDLERVLERDLHIITVLRHPVARTISHYRHIGRDPNHPYHSLVRSQSLEQFLADPITYPLIQNFQARYLARHPFTAATWAERLSLAERRRFHLSVLWEASTLALPDAALRVRAEETLRRCRLVGVVEHYEKFWRDACRLLGLSAPPVARENVAADDGCEADVPEGAAELILRRTAIDLALYELAGSQV